MSLKDVRKGFAALLQNAMPWVTVYDAPRPSVEKAPAIFVTTQKPKPLDDGLSVRYTLAVTMFALAGELGERAAQAEDEIDDMMGGVLAFVDDNSGVNAYWSGAEVVSIEDAATLPLDGQNYTVSQVTVALTVGYGQLA